jgi:hypothetical protein
VIAKPHTATAPASHASAFRALEGSKAARKLAKKGRATRRTISKIKRRWSFQKSDQQKLGALP